MKINYSFIRYFSVQKKLPLITEIQSQSGFARALKMKLPHGNVNTPVFMPVGTKAAIKGVTNSQMQSMDYNLMLSNTYHLANQPGSSFLNQVGGLHNFMNWNRNILTDSGGFQMLSLSKLCQVNQLGVQFINPYDQSKMFLKPQDSIGIQNCIGSDIMMALDDLVPSTILGKRNEQAMERTVRWIDRNISANNHPEKQVLFPIVQGGVDKDLRKRCLDQMIKKDVLGYAIGGLVGGQSKEQFVRTVRQCCSVLPENKPRYLMGVGYPVDLVIGTALGVDMFDCVYPMRTARFGTALTSKGTIKLKGKRFENDHTPIEQLCQCQTCKHHTKSYLSFIQKQQNFCSLITIHNLHYILTLMQSLRNSILNNQLAKFVQQFLFDFYSQQKKIPKWIELGLSLAELKIQHYQFGHQAINET